MIRNFLSGIMLFGGGIFRLMQDIDLLMVAITIAGLTLIVTTPSKIYFERRKASMGPETHFFLESGGVVLSGLVAIALNAVSLFIAYVMLGLDFQATFAAVLFFTNTAILLLIEFNMHTTLRKTPQFV